MQRLEPPPQKLSDLLPNLEKQYYIKPKQPKRILWIMLLIALCTGGALAIFQKELGKIKKKEKSLRHSIRKLQHQTIVADCLGKVPIPLQLANIPFADDTGVVLGVKTIPIRNVASPHNPSLIKSPSGYDLFFRYDLLTSKAKHIPYYSHIGVASLDARFEQTNEEFKKIPLFSNYAEDPRALVVGDQLYLTYNMLDESNLRCRCMALANLDRQTFDVHYTTILDMNLQWAEKNWGPFEYRDEKDAPKLMFEYQISPRTLFSLPDPKKNLLSPFPLPREVAYCSLPWAKTWGQLRGGTPAQKIGDEYLAFFHSSFKGHNGLVWYVMGAYTFQAKPPFAITGMSPYPILFRTIFDTPISNTAEHYKRVIFPSGFVLDKQGDREVVHLACGENDCAVKIVTFDKEKLLESLHRFEIPLNLPQ